jgi:hypothetical protein
LSVPRIALARAISSAGPVRQDQKPVSLHVTVVCAHAVLSNGRCYRTAAPKALRPPTATAPSRASKSEQSATIFGGYFTGLIYRGRRGLRSYNEQLAKYFSGQEAQHESCSVRGQPLGALQGASTQNDVACGVSPAADENALVRPPFPPNASNVDLGIAS